MKPPPFEYYAPTTLAEAVSLLSGQDNARLLAGGQSLMPMLSMRFVLPDRLIDLNGIDELDFIREEGDEIVIGAMVRQRRLEKSPLVASRLPALPLALRYVGHLQTRNRGTLGGSLCQLDPSSELPALATAYDAVIEATGPKGTRRIPFDAFPAFYMTSTLEPDEILSAVRWRLWRGQAGCGFREFSRRHGDFAIAGAVALLEAGTDGRISRASLTGFGIAQAPVRAKRAEVLLVGRKPGKQLFAEAAEVFTGLATLDDAYASAAYRGHVARAMAARALADAAGLAS